MASCDPLWHKAHRQPCTQTVSDNGIVNENLIKCFSNKIQAAESWWFYSMDSKSWWWTFTWRPTHFLSTLTSRTLPPSKVQATEAQCFYGFQIMMENIHLETFSLTLTSRTLPPSVNTSLTPWKLFLVLSARLTGHSSGYLMVSFLTHVHWKGLTRIWGLFANAGNFQYILFALGLYLICAYRILQQ